MYRKIIYTIILITLSILLSSCQIDDISAEKGEYKITNINIFKDTPVWELAVAVRDQKTETIEKIVKNDPLLLNYQESKYGATLLFWAIGMEKFKSAETLLKCGADPNIASKTEWQTPLFLAAGFSWVDHDAKRDPKYVNLLLDYGADPNKIVMESEKFIMEPGASPLMHSIGSGIEKTKALVEAGADINYKTERGYTAAISALITGYNSTLDGMEYAHYLIVEKKAKVTEPYYRLKSYGNEDPNEQFFPVSILRRWIYDLDSEEHRIKMEIVEEFARQGVIYWETEIHKSILESIKKRYPETWKDYIEKY